MEPEDKKTLAWKILGDFPDEYQGMVEFVDRYPELNETPAQFQERCAQVALACFWHRRRELVADRVFGPPVEWKELWEREHAVRTGESAAVAYADGRQ